MGDGVSPELVVDMAGVLPGVLARHAGDLQRALRQLAHALRRLQWVALHLYGQIKKRLYILVSTELYSSNQIKKKRKFYITIYTV